MPTYNSEFIQLLAVLKLLQGRRCKVYMHCKDKNGHAFSSLFALQFLLCHHINSPFLLSTSSTGFNPFKKGLGRTRESVTHCRNLEKRK